MAVCPGQHRDVIGSGERVPPLLHLPITLTLPPLGSAVLEPDLEIRPLGRVKGCQSSPEDWSLMGEGNH